MINYVYGEIEKESQYTREVGPMSRDISKEIEKSAIAISLEHSNTKCRNDKTFQQESGLRLMKECDEWSKNMQ